MMQGQMPQEIEVWYIIPALRREIAKSMIEDYNMAQKQIAGLMGITEAAVSQYLNSKRAKEVTFSNAVLEEVKKAAKRIIEDKSSLVPEMMKLTGLTAVKHVMCDIHHRQNADLPEKCDVCLSEPIVKIKSR